MFFVINKDKIISCVVALTTVIILFLLATTFTTNVNTVETSSKINKSLPVYSVDTEENEVALTINCAW